MFRFYQDRLSVGGVTVHLHHTSRNVQIQGSALLPENKKAPVWFLDNVIKERFATLSQGLAYDISQFNKAVGSLVTKHLHNVSHNTICSGCRNNFNGRSSPEQCTECKLFYHKFKCFPTANHPCYVRKRSQSFSNSPQVRTGMNTLPERRPLVSTNPTTAMTDPAPRPTLAHPHPHPPDPVNTATGSLQPILSHEAESAEQQENVTLPHPEPERRALVPPGSTTTTTVPVPPVPSSAPEHHHIQPPHPVSTATGSMQFLFHAA